VHQHSLQRRCFIGPGAVHDAEADVANQASVRSTIPIQLLYGSSNHPQHICPIERTQQEDECTRLKAMRQRDTGRVVGGDLGLSVAQGAEMQSSPGSSLCGSQAPCWWLQTEKTDESRAPRRLLTPPAWNRGCRTQLQLPQQETSALSEPVSSSSTPSVNEPAT